MKNYPLGIQTFSEIIEHDFFYIDKTKEIYQLLRGKYYFYARPRRFGKSLMLSTIKAIFQGREDLFQRLWIADKWDWSKKHPVIHLEFSRMNYQNQSLDTAIGQELDLIAAQNDIHLTAKFTKDKFRELITKLAQKKAQVVLLIDEYDKPIIDYLGKEIEQAEVNRGILKYFYSVIKASDPYIKFMMITGVSKFSKVSIFSELNNITDITFHRRYLKLTGITQHELEQNFEAEINELAQENNLTPDALKAQIKYWYNGYSWDGKNFLYNPYSILSFFDFGEFKNFWFETGTPTFLLKLMEKQQFVKLENIEAGHSTFSTYNIKHLQLIPLLFQTGYLTIKNKKSSYSYKSTYILDYPNFEVRDSLLQNIIGFLRHAEYGETTPMVLKVREAFQNKQLEHLIRLIKSIFKNIPNQIFKAKNEFYYHSLIHLVFYYLGEFIESEVNTNDGRLDTVIKTARYIYILEFKLDESGQVALEQIKEKGYAEKYYSDERPKILMGINFNSDKKTVDDWQYETLT